MPTAASQPCPPPARRLTRLLCVGGIVTAAAGGVLLAATPALAVSPDVVISEVYGGGGNANSYFSNDFVELYNTGSDPVSLSGWSVQYFSASSGNSGGSTALTGTIAPGRYYLVQEAANNPVSASSAAAALPTPDATGAINLSGSAGQVALVSSGTLPSPAASSSGATVRDYVGYGSGAGLKYEGSAPAPTLSNTTSDSRNQNLDTDQNGNDFTAGTVSATNSAGTTANAPVADNGCTTAGGTTIDAIEGTAITSPLAGSTVSCVAGIVTATESNSFFVQSAAADADPNSSEGLYVYGVTPPPVGDSILVSGQVTNYAAGYSDDYQLNIQTPELNSASYHVVSTGATLPAPVIIGGLPGDQLPPKENVSSDTGDVQTGAFNRSTDALDFWRSLYGMRVQIRDARVTGPNNTGGHGPVVVPGDGVDDGLATPSGGVLYDTYADPNTRTIQVYDNTDPGVVPAASVGDVATAASPVIGVVDFFGNPELEVTAAPAFTSGGLTPQTTSLSAASGQLSVATYNVENLNPQNPASKFASLAGQIVNNLKSPDLIAVEEVQDNDGVTDDGVVSASTTLSMLTQAISAAGGPTYSSTEIDPASDSDGGQPGGNIRQVFLYRSPVQLVPGTPGTSTQADSVTTDASGNPQLALNPGRIDPTNSAWNASRKPLAAEFTLGAGGPTFFAIGNHFVAKLGDAPLYARNQPPAMASQAQRVQQAQAVNGFVSQIEKVNPNANVVVLGDFNDYTFSASQATLRGSQLQDLFTKLPADQQYDYDYQGNSQTLDHILVSGPLFGSASFAPVHVNAEFANQTSDHDPEVAVVTPMAAATPPASLPESPVALLVPLAGLAALGGALALRRRRRVAA